jgi:hypothetical protein
LGEVSYCSRCGKPVELFFLNCPFPKPHIILEKLQNNQDVATAFNCSIAPSKPKQGKDNVAATAEPVIAEVGSILTNPEIVRPTKIIDESHQEYESDATLPIVHLSLEADQQATATSASSTTATQGQAAQHAGDNRVDLSQPPAASIATPSETAQSIPVADETSEATSIIASPAVAEQQPSFPETLGELEEPLPLPATKELSANSADAISSQLTEISAAPMNTAQQQPTQELPNTTVEAARDIIFSRIKNVDEYPEKFDYLVFTDDRGNSTQTKGYQVLGKCKEGDYPALLFPTPELSFAQMLSMFSEKERSDIHTLLQEKKYWETTRLFKKHFPSITFQQSKCFIKKFAVERHIQLRGKIVFALPKLPSAHKKEILKTLKDGKTLQAIYNWRKLTGLELQESREHIAYLCEQENIAYNPTQQEVVPRLWRRLHKPRSKGGWLLWTLALLLALAALGLKLGWLQHCGIRW